jgi:hypothetical protein
VRYGVRSAIGCALLGIAVLLASPALAQRVFVAGQGSDLNPCTFTAPCRTFQHAHDVVAAGGEIDVLDPAGYGVLTITKAISIQGHGFAGISVPVNNIGIQVYAAANQAVSLNGLLLDGNGNGYTGINFGSGQSLTVENCVVRRMYTSGLIFVSTSTAPQTLAVSNSHFHDNGLDGTLIVASSSGAVSATVARSTFFSNTLSGLTAYGHAGTGALKVAVTDSVADNNSQFGFLSRSDVGQPIVLTLTRSEASGNGTGVEAYGTNAMLRLARSTVSGNTTGYGAFSGGVISTYGDNEIGANISFGGVLTSGTKQ